MIENPPSHSLDKLIFTLRAHRVILDADLASLYGVTTKVLNQALKRNINRFPSDFAFQLIPEEFLMVSRPESKAGSMDGTVLRRSQIVTASEKFRNPRFLPWVFTEHGALMASNLLKSEKAAEMSVYVVRAFVRLRQVMHEQEGLARRMAEAELALRDYGSALTDIYDKLEPLLEPVTDSKPARVLGFTNDKE